MASFGAAGQNAQNPLPPNYHRADGDRPIAREWAIYVEAWTLTAIAAAPITVGLFAYFIRIIGWRD